jgi:sialate O-acetylesterase
MSARSTLIIAALLASTAAAAAPTLDPQYGTHAVVQRDRPLFLSGTAGPNERVTVSFAGATASAVADRTGKWRANLPPHAAGGPFAIQVSAPSGITSADDVMVGDVWLCSGQSNMEYPIPRAMGYDIPQANADRQLRLMKVQHQLSATPQTAFAKPPEWLVAGPAVKDFSAACYFMVHELRESEKVPIGAIDDSWGGTPIRAWMDNAAVRASGGADAAAVVEAYRRDPTAGTRQFGKSWGAWWRSKTGDMPGREPWNNSAPLNWKPVPSLDLWDNWGPEWRGWIGSAWLREHVMLTAAEAAQAATLSLGPADDVDQTFVNGIAVGGQNAPVDPRSYPLPKGVLKPGSNEIMVFIRNAWGQGGFRGPADQFALKLANGDTKPLTAGWEYSRIPDKVGEPPTAPWDGASGVSTIYNAMVAPLGPLGVKGVAWYQGETDVGKVGYDRRLAGWMANWRTQFRDPNLPFLIVGLAGWGKPNSHPVESGWAALINEQRLAVERDGHSALASAIDIGDPKDIHPVNKQEVGRRLSLAAHQLVYRDGGAVGPRPISAARQGNAVVVTFTKPLQILSSASASAFELCGPAAGSCRYADARVQGSKVTIAADAQPVTRVRYAWADYPVVNVYDGDMLPVPVFELPVH